MGNVNLARIPEDWGLNQIVFFDSAVLSPSGKQSVRIEPHTGADTNNYRECNTKIGYAVKPGDHIVMKAWIKTGSSTLGQNGVTGNGGFIWFDYYGANGRLHEHSTDDPRGDVESWFTWNLYKQDPGRYVPFNSDWTLRVLDTIVPDLVVDDKTVTPDGFSMGVPTAIIPGCSASGYIVTVNGVPYQQDQGLVWFADAELYINPEPVKAGLNGAGIAVLGLLGLGALYLCLRKRRKR